MKKIDFGKVFIMIVGILFSTIGIGGLRYCINNASSVTQNNWIASVVLTTGGIIFLVVGILFSRTEK